MIINKESAGKKLEIKLDGRLDTNTAPKLEEELGNSIENVEKLIFDLENLMYISSAGLRVILSLKKLWINKEK